MQTYNCTCTHAQTRWEAQVTRPHSPICVLQLHLRCNHVPSQMMLANTRTGRETQHSARMSIFPRKRPEHSVKKISTFHRVVQIWIGPGLLPSHRGGELAFFLFPPRDGALFFFNPPLGHYLQMCVRVRVRVRALVHMRMYVRVCVCMCVCMCVYVSVRVCACGCGLFQVSVRIGWMMQSASFVLSCLPCMVAQVQAWLLYSANIPKIHMYVHHNPQTKPDFAGRRDGTTAYCGQTPGRTRKFHRFYTDKHKHTLAASNNGGRTYCLEYAGRGHQV